MQCTVEEKIMVQNKVIMITGAAGRIGSAFAEGILKNGGKVIIADIFDEGSQRLLDKLNTNDAISVHIDTTNKESISKAIELGIDHFGRIDAAVHSAYPTSVSFGTRFESLEEEGLRQDLFSQLGGAILFSQQIIKYFLEQHCGHLVHISSIQGLGAPKFHHYHGTEISSPIEYSAIKAGVISLTKYLSKYYRKQNIRVNVISPGGILDNQPDTFLKKYSESCNSKGMLDPDDIVGALLFLLSDQSSYINGQNIIIDDGWSL